MHAGRRRAGQRQEDRSRPALADALRSRASVSQGTR